MKIKMKSIHANIVNETDISTVTDVKAKVEIGYNRDDNDQLLLNYHISVGETPEDNLYVIKCTFALNDISNDQDEQEVLNTAVEQLEERIEIILALLTEEMGFELLG